MSQFFYFLTIEGNESLLKEEVRLFFPNLRFAYSRPGFCTFKNAGENLSLEEFAKKRFIFALSYGENLGRIKVEQLDDNISAIDNDSQSNPVNLCFYELPNLKPDEAWDRVAQKYKEYPRNFPVYDLIRTHGQEVFVGLRQQDRFGSPFLRKINSEQEGRVSRAFYKGADALELFKIANKDAKSKTREVLELGCSPGGTTQYLLEKGFKVQGVDPGDMDSTILSHENFIFHKTSVQDFRIFPKNNISILMSDINLNPIMVLGECQRLASFLPNLKYVFITCKFKDDKQLSSIRKYVQMLKAMKMKRIELLQLPYHRKEMLAFASR